VVYVKEPFGGPEQVLKYLTGYTHRVALSNHRLVKLENGRVTFTWKDYADGCRRRADAGRGGVVRRFAMHIVPKGLVRIRQYGLLANRDRGERLALCRSLLAAAGLPMAQETEPPQPPRASGESLVSPTGAAPPPAVVEPKPVSRFAERLRADHLAAAGRVCGRGRRGGILIVGGAASSDDHERQPLPALRRGPPGNDLVCRPTQRTPTAKRSDPGQFMTKGHLKRTSVFSRNPQPTGPVIVPPQSPSKARGWPLIVVTIRPDPVVVISAGDPLDWSQGAAFGALGRGPTEAGVTG
jgi:hypothetical protein